MFMWSLKWMNKRANFGSAVKKREEWGEGAGFLKDDYILEINQGLSAL